MTGGKEQPGILKLDHLPTLQLGEAQRDPEGTQGVMVDTEEAGKKALEAKALGKMSRGR